MAPIGRLPTELILSILSYFCPTSHDPGEFETIVRLSGVCLAWRAALINAPTFWTFIDLNLPINHRNKWIDYTPRLDVFEMQAARSGTVLVDVRLGIPTIDEDASRTIFYIVRSHLPFDRWRSLVVLGEINVVRRDLVGCGEFGNLTSLTLHQRPPVLLMSLIDRSAKQLTSLAIFNKLSFFTDYKSLLLRVSSLSLRSIDTYHLDLPKNITHLELFPRYRVHGYSNFHHVKHLTVDRIDLQSLNSIPPLDIEFLESNFLGYRAEPVVFPRLLRFIVQDPYFRSLSCILAPKLSILEFRMKVEYRMLEMPQDDLQHNLNPITLHIDLSLLGNLTFTVLASATRLQDLHLLVPFESAADTTLVSGLVDEPPNCPSLVKITISLRWRRCEEETWIQYAKKIVDSRLFGTLETLEMEWSCGSKLVISDHP